MTISPVAFNAPAAVQFSGKNEETATRADVDRVSLMMGQNNIALLHGTVVKTVNYTRNSGSLVRLYQETRRLAPAFARLQDGEQMVTLQKYASREACDHEINVIRSQAEQLKMQTHELKDGLWYEKQGKKFGMKETILRLSDTELISIYEKVPA